MGVPDDAVGPDGRASERGASVTLPMERIAEIAKEAIKWTPYPPHPTPCLHDVMDAIAQALREARDAAV